MKVLAVTIWLLLIACAVIAAALVLPVAGLVSLFIPKREPSVMTPEPLEPEDTMHERVWN